MAKPMKVLRIDASGRQHGSSTRRLLDELTGALRARHGALEIRRRDLAEPLPHVDDTWIDANFTAVEDRTEAQRRVLALSDSLVAELQEADTVIIGLPIYNFGVPASLKAWVDLVARARLTFRYTEDGPIGLLNGKKLYLVVASGGVAVDSDADFATPYMRQALAFVGIDDVEVIAADRQNSKGNQALRDARAAIARIVAPVRKAESASQAA
jgi:FMN-dependent NADH-azoreductase